MLVGDYQSYYDFMRFLALGNSVTLDLQLMGNTHPVGRGLYNLEPL